MRPNRTNHKTLMTEGRPVNRSEAIKTIGAILTAGGPHMVGLTDSQVPSPGLFNVQAFGARGDGAGDDQGAIQSAIDAAARSGGGVVWFPRGKYRIHSSIVVPAATDKTVVLR